MKVLGKKSVLHTRQVMFVSICFLILLFAMVISASVFSSTSHAATSVPLKMNYQGRLTNSSGTVLPNGTYNMKLRLYSASTGGTLLWSEDRLVSASTGVTVVNGLFSIRLGDVTTLPASLFNNQSNPTIFLETELPTPATATSSSPTWSEGAMTPRNQMATSAYAFNSDTLDGLDSEAFAQVGGNNTFTGTNTFKTATNSTTGFSIQDSSGTSLLIADTTNDRIYIGQPTADANVTFLAVDTYNGGSADPTGGFNGSIYYNSTLSKFRCYENSAWRDCVTSVPAANGPIASLTSVQGAWGATAAKSAAAAIVVTPLYLPSSMTVNNLKLSVTTALGAAGDVGIYNSSGALVINGGSGSVSTATGVKSITPTQASGSRTLAAGQYYVAVTWNSTTGVISGSSMGVAGLQYSGTLSSGGGSVLPSSITLSSITGGIYQYAVSLGA